MFISAVTVVFSVTVTDVIFLVWVKQENLLSSLKTDEWIALWVFLCNICDSHGVSLHDQTSIIMFFKVGGVLLTKLKENLIYLSVGRSLKIIFDYRSQCEFWQKTQSKEFCDSSVKITYTFLSPYSMNNFS
jgi:hypothetical protein